MGTGRETLARKNPFVRERRSNLSIQKAGGIAAYLNAVVAIATLFVAFGLIGFDALVDNRKLIALALANPTPLVLQDMLKLVSATTGTVLILAIRDRLKSSAPRLVTAATAIGVLAIALLVVNAGLSAYAVSQAADLARSNTELGTQLNALIGILGLSVIFFNGIWYLLTNWQAKKSQRLPISASYLGIVMGVLSLFPPLGVIVLALSVVWSVLLGKALLAPDAEDRD